MYTKPLTQTLPLPNFDGLWGILLKLLTEKGDHVTTQGAVRLTVIAAGAIQH